MFCIYCVSKDPGGIYYWDALAIGKFRVADSFFFFCSRGFLVGELAINDERERKKSTDPAAEQLLFRRVPSPLLDPFKGIPCDVSARN